MNARTVSWEDLKHLGREWDTYGLLLTNVSYEELPSSLQPYVEEVLLHRTWRKGRWGDDYQVKQYLYRFSCPVVPLGYKDYVRDDRSGTDALMHCSWYRIDRFVFVVAYPATGANEERAATAQVWLEAIDTLPSVWTPAVAEVPSEVVRAVADAIRARWVWSPLGESEPLGLRLRVEGEEILADHWFLRWLREAAQSGSVATLPVVMAGVIAWRQFRDWCGEDGAIVFTERLYQRIRDALEMNSTEEYPLGHVWEQILRWIFRQVGVGFWEASDRDEPRGDEP